MNLCAYDTILFIFIFSSLCRHPNDRMDDCDHNPCDGSPTLVCKHVVGLETVPQSNHDEVVV